MASSSSQAEKKGKKKHREKKCKEGWGLILPLSLLHLGWSAPLAFSFPHPFDVEFFMFLEHWALHLSQALCRKTLCYSSSGALLSFGDGVSRKWGERGRRGKFWGKEGGWKILGERKSMCFLFIPKTVSMASSSTGALVVADSLQHVQVCMTSKSCHLTTLMHSI